MKKRNGDIIVILTLYKLSKKARYSNEHKNIKTILFNKELNMS